MTETWGDERKPVAELNKLIERRQRVMRENARDATIATAITALVSLRAATRVSKIRRRRG